MSTQEVKSRLAVYVDGFNLYHAIDDLGENQLKWLNLWALAKSFARPQEEVVKVEYFSALNEWDPAKRGRHRAYFNALEAKGVLVTKGNFKNAPRHCPAKKIMCPDREEKQTDVNIGVSMVSDAYEDVFDRAVLVTADTDQLPTIKLLTAKFPNKKLSWAAPPNRMKQAREIGDLIHPKERLEIDTGRLRACLFGKMVLDVDGTPIVHRPVAYD